jgi:enoyl-CoA hydratase/carnithine racemase
LEEHVSEVRCERRGAALWLTIDRESSRNALNEAVLDGLSHGLSCLQSQPDIRAAVITGAGDKAFCAGGDLKPTAEGDPFRIDPAQLDNPVIKLFRIIVDCPVPVIARVNGHALAGGFGLACATDFAVVADHACLGVPEARIGIFPMMILPYMLRTISRRKLLELCLTGVPIKAADALAHGIVNYVVPLSELDAKVEALVSSVSQCSPTALRMGRRALATIDMLPLNAAFEYAQRVLPQMARTEDAREGFKAFNERRPPIWTGR